MYHRSATSVSCANIALIKYWGNLDPDLRLPANASLSMNLGGLSTRTQVCFDSDLSADRLELNGASVAGTALVRVSAFLDLVRRMAGLDCRAAVYSTNNFPAGVGIASSASAFAALSLAASRAAGLDLCEKDLSRLARRGSGSACRSVPAGYVEWQTGDDLSSYAFSLAPPGHWDLVDCVAVVSRVPKVTGSTEGHGLADTSPLQAARLADAPRRLAVCRQALLHRDVQALAEIVELDSNLMHAVMLSSTPPLFYWQPAILTVMQAVRGWRQSGLPVFYTVDAGPNIHVLCPGTYADRIEKLLNATPGVASVLRASVGGAAHWIDPQPDSPEPAR